jgi:transcriptional regulator with GAF, ATPase, and Fis domain
MKRTFLVIFALVCAYAWPWTGWLKDNAFVTEKTRFIVLSVITIVFIVQQIIVNAPHPANRSRVDARRNVVEFKLNGLLTEYYKRLKGSDVVPPVRSNLSLPTRGRFLPFRQRLKIYFFATSDGSSYSAEEQKLRFKKREGAIGRAWAQKDVIVYDDSKAKFRTPLDSVAQKKLPLVSQIKSILAVPILESGKTVGVLALDSEFAIDVTRFDNADIITLAKSHANDLAGLCFFDGVR